jgi:acetoin utilization protein AcuB
MRPNVKTTSPIPLTVGEYMTPTPVTIDPERTLNDAHQIMRSRLVRHLPVTRGGQLLGIVTARDLSLVESLPGVDPAEVPVEDAMSQEVFTVTPNSPLRMAAEKMAERKLGSAVVVEHGNVVGVFTATDACRVLALVLSLLPPE